jgi:hypothetical protein
MSQASQREEPSPTRPNHFLASTTRTMEPRPTTTNSDAVLQTLRNPSRRDKHVRRSLFYIVVPPFPPFNLKLPRGQTIASLGRYLRRPQPLPPTRCGPRSGPSPTRWRGWPRGPARPRHRHIQPRPRRRRDDDSRSLPLGAPRLPGPRRWRASVGRTRSRRSWARRTSSATTTPR